MAIRELYVISVHGFIDKGVVQNTTDNESFDYLLASRLAADPGWLGRGASLIRHCWEVQTRRP